MKILKFCFILLILLACSSKKDIPFETKDITVYKQNDFDLSLFIKGDTSHFACAPIDFSQPGKQKITCQDTTGEYKDTTIHVTVVDQTAPEITLTRSHIQLPIGSTYHLDDYLEKAIDEVDGDLTTQVTYVDTINSQKAGTYEVIYTVSDHSGNTGSASLKVDITTFYEEYFDASTLTPEMVQDPNDIHVLVNKTHALSSNYEPNDLTLVYQSQDVYLRQEAAQAYKEFVLAAQQQGITVIPFSGYRSYSLQTRLYNNYLNRNGPVYTVSLSAYPGRSEHQLGLAIDISDTWDDPLNASLGQRALGKFIKNEAYRYGFILRYPKDKTAITNYAYEPWHIRYVGKEMAKEIHDRQITLEEYYE